MEGRAAEPSEAAAGEAEADIIDYGATVVLKLHPKGLFNPTFGPVSANANVAPLRLRDNNLTWKPINGHEFGNKGGSCNGILVGDGGECVVGKDTALGKR